MREVKVAIVGATGLVGQEALKVLQQRKFPLASLHLYATGRSVGKKVFVDHRELEIKEATAQALEGVDLAFFTAGAEVSLHLAPLAAKAGTVVVDTSPAFRLDPSIPLIVPEVNAEDLKGHRGLIASPNSCTVQTVIALYPLHRVNPIKRVTVATYEAVSGSGSAGMEELSSQSRLVLEGRRVIPHIYPHQIAFNVIPEVDVFLDNGYSRQEQMLAEETRKVLHAETLALSATCVRVPVFIGHGLALHLQLTHQMSAEEARRLLAEAARVKVLDDLDVSLYPQPWSVAGQDDVFVGRIREDMSHPSGLAFWVAADNIRNGAALNIVRIAEELLKNNWLPGDSK